MLFLVSCWLLGSIPTAFLICTIWNKKPLTTGNFGFTYTFKNVGKTAGILLLFSEFIIKVLIPMVVSNIVISKIDIGDGEIVKLLTIICVVTGNAWSIFTKMKGGRSVLILYLSLVFWNPIVWMFVVTIPLCSMLMDEDTAPFVALALILLPIMGYGDLTTQALLGLLVCIMLSKRVTANQILKLPQMNTRLLFNRLLCDRDNV